MMESPFSFFYKHTILYHLSFYNYIFKEYFYTKKETEPSHELLHVTTPPHILWFFYYLLISQPEDQQKLMPYQLHFLHILQSS